MDESGNNRRYKIREVYSNQYLPVPKLRLVLFSRFAKWRQFFNELATIFKKKSGFF